MLFFYLQLIQDEEQQDRFTYIYKKYAKLMQHEAYAITKNKASAEDAVHDAFLAIINKMDILRFDNPKKLCNLVVVIVRNKAIDSVRKQSKEQLTDDGAAFDEPGESPEDAVVNISAWESMVRVVNKLDEKYKLPLYLRAEGYKVNEIAAILDITQETAKVRLHRGRKMVQSRLAREDI